MEKCFVCGKEIKNMKKIYKKNNVEIVLCGSGKCSSFVEKEGYEWFCTGNGSIAFGKWEN